MCLIDLASAVNSSLQFCLTFGHIACESFQTPQEGTAALSGDVTHARVKILIKSAWTEGSNHGSAPDRLSLTTVAHVLVKAVVLDRPAVSCEARAPGNKTHRITYLRLAFADQVLT